MNQFHKLFRWAWSILVVCSLAFAMGGCEGDDGAQGPAGPAGATGPQGDPGVDASRDPVADAVLLANFESCDVCHDGAGGYHQAYYDEYVDSTLVMAIEDVTSTPNGALFDLEVTFSLLKDGVDYIADPATFDSLGFYITTYNGGEFVTSGGGFYGAVDASGTGSNGDGTYTFTTTVDYDVDTFDGGAITGKVGLGVLDFPDNPYNPGGGRRIRGYVDLATATAQVGGAALDAWESAANVEACEGCHGAPYRKHANIEAVVAGAPDFAQCKACHVSDKPGGHPEWQYMVDEPFNWATGVAATEDYSYTRNLMNDVHMSHAMEFPYPQSMANCATCHAGKLAAALDDDNFRPDVCKSCHVVQGIDAWPEDAGDTAEGLYAQPLRPPPLEFLWARAGAAVESLHQFPDINTATCTLCHGDIASSFSDYHTGYNTAIYDDTGVAYADQYSVSIDNVGLVGNLMTIDVSATDANVVAEVLVSFYGWDTKNFIVASHERDVNRERMEYEFGSGGSALFTEAADSVAGDWSVTLDVSAYVPAKSTLDTIPNMIADGRIKKAMVTVTPMLTVDGTGVALEAKTADYDIVGDIFPVTDYFAGTMAPVDVENCNACHDVLTTTFHLDRTTGAPTGRGGGTGAEVCKNCHVTTTRGSHLEMQSRGIDSYVHAIHAFQPFDEDDVFAADNPVFNARNDQHKHHAFPYFTSLACEGCHNAGTYEVPDQSASMPGVIGDSWEARNGADYGRNIGEFPEAVTGAASRACGSCHRAEWIKEDHAGDLAAFNAHTGTFGTFIENDPKEDASGDDPVLWGIIDKIMSIF